MSIIYVFNENSTIFTCKLNDVYFIVYDHNHKCLYFYKPFKII